MRLPPPFLAGLARTSEEFIYVFLTCPLSFLCVLRRACNETAVLCACSFRRSFPRVRRVRSGHGWAEKSGGSPLIIWAEKNYPGPEYPRQDGGQFLFPFSLSQARVEPGSEPPGAGCGVPGPLVPSPPASSPGTFCSPSLPIGRIREGQDLIPFPGSFFGFLFRVPRSPE